MGLLWCLEPSRLSSPPARRASRSRVQALGPGQQPSALRAATYDTTAQLSEGARSLWSRVWCFRGYSCNSDHLMLKFKSWPPVELNDLWTCYESTRQCRAFILCPSANQLLLIRSMVTYVNIYLCSSYKHYLVKSFVHYYVRVTT